MTTPLDTHRDRLSRTIVARQQESGHYRLDFGHADGGGSSYLGPEKDLDGIAIVRRWLINGGWLALVDALSDGLTPSQVASLSYPDTRSVRLNNRGYLTLWGSQAGPEMDYHDIRVVYDWVRWVMENEDIA